jgi:hypothetical protein
MKDKIDTARAADVPAPLAPALPDMLPSFGPAPLECTPPGRDVAKHTSTPSASLDYVIDQEQRLITITGPYSDAEEWKILLSRVLHDPRHEAGFAFLRDLRHDNGAAEPERVAPVIGAIRAFWPYLQPCRGAVLTAGDSERAAFAVDALANTHGLPVRIFDSYQAAMTWLESGP